MKQFVLVGHRGVGKSSLLNNLKQNFPEFTFLSLDDEIVKRGKRAIEDIFAQEGEEVFREVEKEIFKQVVEELKDQSFVIDLGAGFIGNLPSHIDKIWIRRQSHSSQALFLDRPKLDQKLQMSESRYQERERRYQSWTDLTLELREGPDSFQEGELQFFKALLRDEVFPALQNYHYTLKENTTPLEMKVLRNLGIRGFEYRNDLVEMPKEIEKEDLVSFRNRDFHLKEGHSFFDWPLEWGVNNMAPVLSLHQKGKSLGETLKSLPVTHQIVKLAVPVLNFSELQLGHRWAQQKPKMRTFLPMSEDGRWNWYRQWTGDQSPLTFVRMGEGSAKDQPTVLQILNQNFSKQFFAAVLGSPVMHSWTPTYHQKFFKELRAPVYAIDVSLPEWDVALPFLQELGLRWAAITSPLKELAGQQVGSSKPLNTLCFNSDAWIGTNTDDMGLEELLKGFEHRPMAIWGGGGILPSLQKIRPDINYYSSRTGLLKSGQSIEPKVLVWAVGKNLFKKEGCFPPENWPIETVLDLNYTSDSPGIECASRYRCQYASGSVMFFAQAQEQQQFWNRHPVQ